MKPRQLSQIAILCIFTAGFSVAQESSLAEQAAAARGRPASVVQPSVMGHTVAGDYYNEVLGFQIRHIPGWTSMSRGTMNVDEAIGREALGLQAGISQSAYRVFGMRDEDGDNVMVSIVPMPAGGTSDPAELKAGLTKVLKAGIPSSVISDETILLGDGEHRFTGIRATYSVADHELSHSLQIIHFRDYGICIGMTTVSAPKLQSLLGQLRSSFQWTQRSAQ